MASPTISWLYWGMPPIDNFDGSLDLGEWEYKHDDIIYLPGTDPDDDFIIIALYGTEMSTVDTPTDKPLVFPEIPQERKDAFIRIITEAGFKPENLGWHLVATGVED